MKSFFAKRNSKLVAVLLTFAVLLASFAWAVPVNAETTADMQKANVKWDLRNNKTLKFKTSWSFLGVKTHTVKMTKFKVKKAKKAGYKQCTFTLTFNRAIKPNKVQVTEMDEMFGECGSFGGDFYFTVVDYETGESLEVPNDKGVTVTGSKWKYSGKVTKKGNSGSSIWYKKKATVKVTILYPSTYKNLAIGVGGLTVAPHYVDTEDDYEVVNPNANGFFDGVRSFSEETLLYSKTDKSFAHFMRVTK